MQMSGAVDRTQAPTQRWDDFKQRMMELLLSLVQFSYYSTPEDLRRAHGAALTNLAFSNSNVLCFF